MQPTQHHEVEIRSGSATIVGDLSVPSGATGTVVFAHGSGSSRHSPRNRMVAGHLAGAGFSTLLLDLLTVAEEAEERVTRHHRFNIELLSSRLADASRFVSGHPATGGLPQAYFGASTGAAAALAAAAEEPRLVEAVVSRGGRPDLAGEALPAVQAPTLLIVGSRDVEVLDLNRRAAAQMTADVSIAIVEGATHLFSEPGTLEEVASLAQRFLLDHLGHR